MAQFFLDDLDDSEVGEPNVTGTVVESEPGRIRINFDNGEYLVLRGSPGSNTQFPLPVGKRVIMRPSVN